MDRQELYDYILDNLQYRLEQIQTRNGLEWCLYISDYSGRDFGDSIPLQYVTEDRIEALRDEVWDDAEYECDCELDLDEFDDVFEEVFYNLVDENLGK